MKCHICGAESGKYPLCRACNLLKEKGDIIKCTKCNKWHYKSQECTPNIPKNDSEEYLYTPKNVLISKSEQEYYDVIKSSLPDGYCIFPQINLATFIDRTDNHRFHNELFRNVDFLITSIDYRPLFIIEINDRSHLDNERKKRDEKVQKICEEAGIPVVKFWTSYGVNTEYINGKIEETLASLPIQRIHHFTKENPSEEPFVDDGSDFTSGVRSNPKISTPSTKSGCYVATCVYGSYDCPQVWILRRYRDVFLANTLFGRLFIKIYYKVSPILVKHFGDQNWFKGICKKLLDRKIIKLRSIGYLDTPYTDL